MRNSLSELIIRAATKADVPKIVDLHVRSWGENYTQSLSAEFLESKEGNQNRLNTWSRRLSGEENPNQYVAIAEVGVFFAGFICAYANRDPDLGSLIDNLHVDPKSRKQGIATMLMHFASMWLNKKSPAKQVYLEAYAENSRAQRFYQSIGGKSRTKEPFTVKAVDGGETLSYHMIWKTPTQLTSETKQKLSMRQQEKESAQRALA